MALLVLAFAGQNVTVASGTRDISHYGPASLGEHAVQLFNEEGRLELEMDKRTLEIAERCRFSLDELAYQYPEERMLPGLTPQQALEKLTWEGATERFPEGVPDKVVATLKHELQLIEKLQYAPYFLTVNSIVRFARSQHILCQGIRLSFMLLFPHLAGSLREAAKGKGGKGAAGKTRSFTSPTATRRPRHSFPCRRCSRAPPLDVEAGSMSRPILEGIELGDGFDLVVFELVARQDAEFTTGPEECDGDHEGASKVKGVVLRKGNVLGHPRAPSLERANSRSMAPSVSGPGRDHRECEAERRQLASRPLAG